MFNYDSNYRTNDKFDIIADGYLVRNGTKNDYCEKVDFYKKTNQNITVFEINEVSEKNGIRFALKEKQNASRLFLKDILEFLCLPDHLLYKDNRLRTEYASCVLNSKYIEVSDAVIDQNFILLIQKYFKNLEELFFNNCIIKTNCCFNKNDYQIVSFNKCEFETMRCLNDLDSYSLGLNRCLFDNVTSTTLNVKRFNAQSDEDSEFENIFIHCYFPKLETLNIRGYVNLDKSLMFLPFSCPNVFKLNIKADGIENISYLYNLTNLSECDINIFEDLDNTIVKRETLNYSRDDIEIYLNKKMPKMVYNIDEPIENDFYFMYDDTKNSIWNMNLLRGDKLHTWKNGSWIEKELHEGGFRRKISPIICPKPSIIHPTGKVLLFSINPYNYKGQCEKVSELKR